MATGAQCLPGNQRGRFAERRAGLSGTCRPAALSDAGVSGAGGGGSWVGSGVSWRL